MSNEQRSGDTKRRRFKRLEAVAWFLMVLGSSVAAAFLIITDKK